MRFASLYRISLYALVTLGTLILNMDADVQYARFYPIGVAIASAIAFLTVDRDPRLGLGNMPSNLIGLLSVGLVYLEVKLDDTLLVLSVGHWLCYLTLVKLFRPKSDQDDWTLILLSLVQVLVGCVLSQSDRVGFSLIAWALLALWVLSLFYLQRESRRRLQADSAVRDDPYPGLLAPPFVFATIRAGLLTLACGVFIFFVMPRSSGRTPQTKGPAMAKTMTGFSEEVRLGQMGEILENDSVVMSVEMFDESRQRIRPEGEPLWRGVVLNYYENGRWRRGQTKPRFLPVNRNALPSSMVEHRIRLEPATESVVFVPRPFSEIRPRGDVTLEMSSDDGTVVRELGRNRLENRSRSGDPLEYTVRSPVHLDLEGVPGLHRQVGEERIPRDRAGRDPLLHIPGPELKARFEAIARSVLAERLSNAPTAPRGTQLREPTLDAIARARVLESYLKDSGLFTYDLTMVNSNPDVDPILDFLENRRRGHCAYYASALAMLLRSVDIPCRVVNGFKGGDWNGIVNVLTVRQKHTHSWVEACVNDRGGTPLWLTLDPTPGDERDLQVARVGKMPGGFRQFADLVRYVWVFYVAGFNSERQEELLYGPIRRLAQEARNGFRLMRIALERAFVWMTDYPSISSFFSVRGFVTSCLVMLLLAGLFRALLAVYLRVIRRLRGPDHGMADFSGALAAYARLVKVLSSCGLERPPGETPQEFARRASLYLADRMAGDLPIREVPARVVDAFYSVRFGGEELAPGSLEALEARVDALEAVLRPVAS